MSMGWSARAPEGERARSGKPRGLLAVSALGAALALSGCGGRAADPVSEVGAFDLRLSCAHIAAESEANTRRIEDLRDERNTNRLRNLTRVPGALIGNPLSALALADTSRAIYIEIDALEARNKRLEELTDEKKCGQEEDDGFGATLVGGVVGGAAGFLEKAVSVAGEAVGAVGDAADQAGKLFSGEEEAPAAPAEAGAAVGESEPAIAQPAEVEAEAAAATETAVVDEEPAPVEGEPSLGVQ